MWGKSHTYTNTNLCHVIFALRIIVQQPDTVSWFISLGTKVQGAKRTHSGEGMLSGHDSYQLSSRSSSDPFRTVYTYMNVAAHKKIHSHTHTDE